MCGRRLIDKGFFSLMQHWSGAVMCPAFECSRSGCGPWCDPLSVPSAVAAIRRGFWDPCWDRWRSRRAYLGNRDESRQSEKRFEITSTKRTKATSHTEDC